MVENQFKKSIFCVSINTNELITPSLDVSSLVNTYFVHIVYILYTLAWIIEGFTVVLASSLHGASANTVHASTILKRY